MQYQKPSFTLPAGSSKVSAAEWERIFGKPTRRKREKKTATVTVKQYLDYLDFELISTRKGSHVPKSKTEN